MQFTGQARLCPAADQADGSVALSWIVGHLKVWGKLSYQGVCQGGQPANGLLVQRGGKEAVVLENIWNYLSYKLG